MVIERTVLYPLLVQRPTEFYVGYIWRGKEEGNKGPDGRK